jgi:hypothetical protein
VGFLRRFRGGAPDPEPEAGVPASGDDEGDGMPTAEDEVARDRELMREESRRLDDDLLQRQMRYADRSWTPPAQGGPRRADDEESEG